MLLLPYSYKYFVHCHIINQQTPEYLRGRKESLHYLSFWDCEFQISIIRSFLSPHSVQLIRNNRLCELCVWSFKDVLYSSLETAYRLKSFVMSRWLCVCVPNCCLLFVRVGNVLEKRSCDKLP